MLQEDAGTVRRDAGAKGWDFLGGRGGVLLCASVSPAPTRRGRFAPCLSFPLLKTRPWKSRMLFERRMCRTLTQGIHLEAR